MPIAGSVIFINSSDNAQAEAIVKAIRDNEKDKAYYHVGYSLLRDHFLPKGTPNIADYLPALYGAISGTARCGADVLVDITIQSAEQYHVLEAFIHDLDVVWVNVGVETEFAVEDMHLDKNVTNQAAAEKVMDYIASRYNHAEAYARWAPEVSPAPAAARPGNIILLVGGSSSGKSTLSKAVQAASTETYLNVGIDTAVLQYLHLRYYSGAPQHENDESWRTPDYNPTDYHKTGCSWIAPGPNAVNPHDYIRFQVGREARRSISAMYATIAEMSRLGVNVISDHCFHFPNTIKEAAHRFQDLPVSHVSLCPSLDVINTREKQRDDRREGTGMSIYHQMLDDYAADLKIDTGVISPEEGAKQVLELLDKQ